MTSRYERSAERDRRESVAGVAERREQEALGLGAQIISASSRTIRTRAAGSADIGVRIIVPTPASR